MSDAHKPSTYGRSDDRLEQILRQPLRDPCEDILDELTELTIDAERTGEENARLWELFDELEKSDPIEIVPQDDEADQAFLRELHKMIGSPSAMLTADSAAAKNNVKKQKRKINGTECSVKKPRKIYRRLLPLVAILVMLLGAVSSQACGNGIFEMFAKWTSEIFRLNDSAKPEASIGCNDMEPGELREYATQQEMLDDFGIKGQLLPAWLPDGMGEPECWATYNDGGGLKLYILYDTSKSFLKIQLAQITKEDATDAERDYHDMESWEKDGIRHYQITDLDLAKIAWINGEFECHATTDLDGETLRQIVESIYGGQL